ncbi:hypothetical protein AZ032_002698 [Klebsiella pneumoniae]|nr:hypothetical protein AZ032_002698 [Klebsiella pneumoniae]
MPRLSGKPALKAVSYTHLY